MSNERGIFVVEASRLDHPAGTSPSAWPPASSLTVRCLMRAGPPIDPDDRLAAAAARMCAAHLGALTVVEAGRLVGLVTERDLVRAVAEGLSTDVLCVADVMSPAPAAVGPRAEASCAARTMIGLRARHLPVVSDGHVVGLISASDLLLAWGVPGELLGEEAPLGAPLNGDRARTGGAGPGRRPGAGGAAGGRAGRASEPGS